MNLKTGREKIVFYCCIVLIFCLLAVHFIAPRVIIQTSNKLFTAYRYNERGDISKIPFPADTLKLITHDGLLLKGFIIYTPIVEQKGTVIFLHGIRASKELVLPMAEKIAYKGYNSVIFDLRAHGESDGKFCTYGYYEKHDVSTLLDTLEQNSMLNKNFGVWGQSLGGSIGLQILAIDPRLKFGIIESAFSNFNKIVHDYAHYNLKFDIEFLTNYCIFRSGKLGDFNPEEVSPKNAAKYIGQPLIIVHGAVDNRIDKNYSLELFKLLNSKSKKLIIIDSAKHTNVWEKGAENYVHEVLGFIDSTTCSK